MDDLRHLTGRIRRLLELRAADPGSKLTDVEDTLTDGYAAALELQRRRLGIERRMSKLALTVERPEEAGELRRLAAQLAGVEAELAELRSLLTELRKASRSAA
jgi:hypothetical protein